MRRALVPQLQTQQVQQTQQMTRPAPLIADRPEALDSTSMSACRTEAKPNPVFPSGQRAKVIARIQGLLQANNGTGSGLASSDGRR